jgi:adenylyltransferase/sulfurtransferase
LESLETKLADLGPVERNPYLLRFQVDGFVLTIFADGRTIVAGTDDPATAQSVHARYIGN